MEIKGLRVLLVDDLTDTGDTLDLALQHIRAFQPAAVKVAMLHHKRQSLLQPDFYVKKVVKWRWLIYPWAIVEDIGGFLRAMPEMPTTVETANSMLQARHGITVPRRALSQVFEMLAKER